ncbi:unnamed protein product [Triticum turgidum subsp. durum]|uniref:Uncharacterized protein n=1 Tax=Triticum turgidum subsp. durum TaxID=4567 RepID=A0A9R0S4L5_TRITD|nr:unnamed protein product [Triticum turgidum subsp. durum]
MGETAMGGYGLDKPPRCSISFDTPCGALLRELEQIWTEIGEQEQDKDRMFQELEAECMRVYRRKVDSANADRSQLRQSVMAKEAELKALVASIGENTTQFKVNEKHASLKEQLAAVTPLLDDLRAMKEERIKQFSNVQSQIETINAQISDHNCQHDDGSSKRLTNDHDLSTRRLADLQMQLRNLQKEKSDRLQKVFVYVDEVHCLCAVLGMDFAKTVKDVHPSLHGTNSDNSTNISDSTLEGLTQTILKLKAEKRTRVSKLQEIVGKLHKLWNLMESTEQERRHFSEVAAVLGSSEEEITSPSVLSLETIQETEQEVERLTKQKASRMKELVLKRRVELENICRNAHMEPDTSTAPEKIVALIDSGLVDPCELLSNIEAQIAKANEESYTRKDIMERVDKWLSACDEETWLEEYNQDDNRYSAGRGAHLNLKRAEKARVLVQKIPTMIDNLIDKTFAWEDESNTPFLYDGFVWSPFWKSRNSEEYRRRKIRNDTGTRRSCRIYCLKRRS